MKRGICLLALVIIITEAFNGVRAQVPSFSYAEQEGGDGMDSGYSITTDACGNSIVTGCFQKTATFGKAGGNQVLLTATGVSYGKQDLFIAKYDPEGELIWVKQAASGGSRDLTVCGYSVRTDRNCQVFVTGYFNGDVALGSTILNSSSNDAFIAKLDADGNFLWAKKVGGPGNDKGKSIYTDSLGNAVVTGWFQYTANVGDVTFTSGGGSDVFIAKYDSNGDFIWARQGNGTGSDYGNAIAADAQGNVLVSGVFNGSLDFDNSTLTSFGGDDVFLVKYDPAGNLLWTKQAGGVGADRSYGGLTIHPSNGIVLTGTYYLTATFDSTTLTSPGGSQIFMAKYAADGTLLWVKQDGGTAAKNPRATCTDARGNIIITGFFNTAPGSQLQLGNAAFTSFGYDDVFVAKYDINGNFIWATQEGGASWDWSRGVATDAAGNIIITGEFRGTANFGSATFTAAGAGRDIFISKYLSGESVVTNADDTQWAKRSGGTAYDYGKSVTTDVSGNAIVAGYFKGTATLGDTSLTASGMYDIFLSKYKTDGTLAWTRQAGGTDCDHAHSVTTDSWGNSIVVGEFKGTAFFGSTSLISSGEEDVFVAKYDAGGNLAWARKAGGSYEDVAYGVSTDANGNVFVTGLFHDKAIFGDYTLIANGSYSDLFIAKYAANGVLLWVRQAGGTAPDLSQGIDTDLCGNAIITGYFRDQTDFEGTTLISEGLNDVFIAKYDFDGNLVWVRKAGGESYDYSHSISVDASGAAVIAGRFKKTATFENTTISAQGHDDIFVAKYDSDGNYLWVNQAGGSSQDIAYAVTTDSESNVIVSGSFFGTAYFNNTWFTSSGSADMFLMKYNPQGTYLWAKHIQGNKSVRAYGISTDVLDHVFVTGGFAGTASFGDETLSATGTWSETDIFAAKFDAEGELLTNSSTTSAKKSTTIPDNEGDVILHSYPNPFHQQLTIRLENLSVASVVIHNTLGEQVWEGKFIGGRYTKAVATGHWAEGLYSLHAYDTKGAMMKIVKLIKTGH